MLSLYCPCLPCVLHCRNIKFSPLTTLPRLTYPFAKMPGLEKKVRRYAGPFRPKLPAAMLTLLSFLTPHSPPTKSSVARSPSTPSSHPSSATSLPTSTSTCPPRPQRARSPSSTSSLASPARKTMPHRRAACSRLPLRRASRCASLTPARVEPRSRERMRATTLAAARAST